MSISFAQMLRQVLKVVPGRLHAQKEHTDIVFGDHGVDDFTEVLEPRAKDVDAEAGHQDLAIVVVDHHLMVVLVYVNAHTCDLVPWHIPDQFHKGFATLTLYVLLLLSHVQYLLSLCKGECGDTIPHFRFLVYQG